MSFEELEKDERPPKSIWLDDEALARHFEWVEARREEKYGSREETIEDPVQNDAARELLVG